MKTVVFVASQTTL